MSNTKAAVEVKQEGEFTLKGKSKPRKPKQLGNKEQEREDRKDDRIRMEGTQQSEMIEQRKTNGLPINFEEKDMTGLLPSI